MIRAVVFDWGGVIQRTEDVGPRRALGAELGLPPGGVERAVFECDIWREASLGRVSADVAWAAIGEVVGVKAEALDDFVERFWAGDRVDAKLVRLIRELRARGYLVGLLSNALPDRKRGVSAAGRWGMERLFDAQVFSYQVGALKPDRRMYAAILSALGARAAETLFIDDAPANVQGARDAGMAAIHFTGRAALTDELTRLGVL